MMQLFNTPAGQKQEFTPLNDDKVTLYTCGPTVYGDLHVGNWIAYVRWDVLVRTLVAAGYEVERVMNITDVGHLVSDADEGEDKIEKGARREGVSAWEISRRYTDSFIGGMKRLNLLEPTHLAKATDYIPEQIDLIRRLEAGGHTYQTSDGVYFDTATFAAYADFAHLHLDDLKAGARVEQNAEKRQPSDFALWKFSPKDRQRDMEWNSPWGKGFPGWHIECSAIAMKLLGETIDIHTGGIDHIPIHHTNEIAQSEAATGKPFARYWLHTNFLLVNGTKISKSLNNGFTLDDVLEKGFSADDYRMFVLQSHYRTESNFTWDNLEAAHNRLKRWYALAELRWQLHDTIKDDEDKAVSDISLQLRKAPKTCLELITNDLNTPELLSYVEPLITQAFTHRADLQQDVLVSFLEFLETVTGLQLLAMTPDIDDDAKQLIIERQRAREKKDYATSDRLRDELHARSVRLNDDSDGQTWSRQTD